MKIKPGKYVQRDGGIATVAAVDESKQSHHQAIGWRSDGIGEGWRIDGRYLDGTESMCDLMREYREPRERWVVADCAIYDSKELAQARYPNVEAVHYREVIE